MNNERLAAISRPAQGRRLCVLSGKALHDLFYLSDTLGAQRVTEALGELAVNAKFDVALSVGAEGTLRFQKPEMQSVFDKLTSAPTQARPGEAAREPFRPQPREPKEANGTAQVAQVEQHGADPLRNQLARVERALASPLRIQAIMEYPEDLWVGTPSARAIETLRVIGRAAVSTAGHPESTLALLVKPERLEEFLGVLDQVRATEQFRRSINLLPPGRDEVEKFLSRFMLRESLPGSKAQVVSEAVGRGWLLFHLHEALRGVLLLPAEKRNVERALDTGEKTELPDAVMAEMDQLVGLAPIKEQLKLFAAVARQQQEDVQQGRAVQVLNTHMLFLGNPGTGKTEVARLVARYLRAIGLRASGEVLEIGQKDIASPLNPGECIRNMREAIDKAMGGVLFVDEAYDMAEDEWMQQALQTLMKDMEDRRGSLTVIFAGYENRMQALWKVNEGFRSRLPEQNWFRFPDYSVEELTEIWSRMCASRHLTLSPDARPAAARHIKAAVPRGRFDNARGVRNLVDGHVLQCALQSTRVVSASFFPPVVTHDSAAVDKLLKSLRSEFVGLEDLHRHLETVARKSRRAEQLGKPIEGPHHCRFVGPPGTGKTTAARKMGAVFKAMGLLSQGHVHVVNPVRDLMSAYVSEYANCVAKAFESARGGVLFIDEAYRLNDQEQGRKVLDEIVQTLTLSTFADTIVVLAGYQEEMNGVMQANPGLESRIPHEVVFDELTDGELIELFYRSLKSQDLIVHAADTSEVDRRLTQVLSELRSKPNFASARTLQGMVQDVVDRQLQRIEQSESPQRFRIVPDDVAKAIEETGRIDQLLERFSDRFVGMEELKLRLRQLTVSASMSRSRGAAAPLAPRMLFLGNPGTGKTMAAREIGGILRAIGCSLSDRYVEIPGVELKGSFVGQTKDKVLSAFQNARGGMLFIDEAYSLQVPDHQSGDSFAAEAIDALVGQSQLPENLHTAVILAGYVDPMRRFLKSNPGLKRRFPEVVVFADYSTPQCVDILRSWLTREESVQEGVIDTNSAVLIGQAVDAAKEQGEFGNAGDMETLGRCLLDARNLRCAVGTRKEGEWRITPEDVVEGVRTWVARRQL